MDSILNMGGYGGYVWPAYIAGVLAMALLLVVSLRSARGHEAELEKLQQARQDRPGGRRRNAKPEATA